MPPLADGSNRGATDTFGTRELLVQADVEPDKDCDTLGDETLGTSGALLAGLVVAWWTAPGRRRGLRKASSVERSTGQDPDVPSTS